MPRLRSLAGPVPALDGGPGGGPYDAAAVNAALRLFRSLEWLVGDPGEAAGRVALARALQRRVPPLDLRPGFGGLPDQLGGLVPALSEAEAESAALRGALAALGTRGGGGRPEEGLEELAGAHAALAGMLAAGLRNDAPDAALIVRQRCRAAELALEDELARRLAAVRRAGGELGTSPLAGAAGTRGLTCGLRALGAAGFRACELGALAAEMSATVGAPAPSLAERAASEAGALRQELAEAAGGAGGAAPGPAAAAAVEASLARQVELLARLLASAPGGPA